MAKRKPDPRTVALNLISEHGKASFQRLINLFGSGASGTKIGAAFGVSRQRVSQWRAALGIERTSYEVFPEIADLVDQEEPRSTKRTLV